MAIGSHTIPAFYLRQFATRPPARRKHGLLWVYEKNREPEHRNLRIQGKEKGYFSALQPDGSLNDWASEAQMTAIENECNDVLHCAGSELFDWSSTSNRRKLALYMAFLYSRATQRRNHSRQVSRQVAEELDRAAANSKLMQDLADAVNAAAGAPVLSTDSIRERVVKLAQLQRDPKQVNTDFASNVRDLTECLMEILSRRTWQLWRAPAEREFVTSDNPVINFMVVGDGVFHPGHGFNRPGVVTGFPLSPEACVVVGFPNHSAISPKVSDDEVRNMNEALISICDRYVYSRTRSGDVQDTVQRYAGTFRYGTNALLPIEIEMPSVEAFIRRAFGLDTEK